MGLCFDNAEYLDELAKSAALPEEILERYELVDMIKQPPEQAVYKLKGRKDGKYYILKCRSNGFGEDAKNEFAMLRLLSSLGFDAAPVAVSFFEKNDKSFLIEECLEGETAAARVERMGAMKLKEALDIWLQLCDILECLHNQSPALVHRDIKPEHIMIAPDGKVRLLDLGIARKVREGQSRDTVFCGTEQTAAPEQYGFKQTDARTDIYAMGVTMHYMVTGLYDINAPMYEVPKRAREIINICMSFDPDDRYESAARLRSALKSLGRPALLRGSVSAKPRKAGRIVAACAVTMAVLTFAVFGSGWIERVNAMQVYKFLEPRIEKAARHELQKNENEPVYVSELKNIKQLALLDSREADSNKIYEYSKGYDIYTHENDVFEDIVVSVEDVGHMTNLERLALINQDIRDISPLAGLEKLQVLAISGNAISDFTPLAGLKGLTALNIGANPAADLTPIGELSGLTLLETHCLAPDNLKFLSSLQNLNELRLMWCTPKNGDYSPISDLKNLYAITMHNIGTEVIPFIGNGVLPNLRYVALVGDRVVYTPKEIASLSAITELDMNGVLVRDTDCLRALVNLKRLAIIEAPNTIDFSFIDDMPELYYLNILGTEPVDCRPFARHPMLFKISCEEDVKNAILALVPSQRFIFNS